MDTNKLLHIAITKYKPDSVIQTFCSLLSWLLLPVFVVCVHF